MDRLACRFVAFGLGLLLAASGCRSTRNEVPPGRPFAKDGQQRKAIEFSSGGHPVSAAASANFVPSNLGGSNMASGIGANGARPDGSAMGGPSGAYGPPGTAGMEPGTGDPSTTRASGGSLGTPPPGVPPLESPPSASSSLPPREMPPPREVEPMPSQTVVPALDGAGSMGSASAPPSPN